MNVNVMGMDEISIDKARPKLGDLVHAAQNGTTTVITRNGHPAAIVAPIGRLTDIDRRVIARSRELAATSDSGALRILIGSDPGTDWAMLRAEALGVARFLLVEMAAIIDRLDGHSDAHATEPRGIVTPHGIMELHPADWSAPVTRVPPPARLPYNSG